MLIAVCGMKGAPGATTVALGLAAVLPEAARPVVVEADAAGGDLAAPYGLATGRGLVGLATATRALSTPAPSAGQPGPPSSGYLLSRHAWQIQVGDRRVELVCAPPGGAQTQAALSVLTAHPGVLCPPDRVVVADCGRLEPGGAAWPLVGAASVVLVVARPTVAGVAHLVEQAPAVLAVAGGRVGLLLAPGGTYTAADVADLLRYHRFALPVVDSLPHDPRAAAVLAGTNVSSPRWHRWPLPSALARLAASFAALPVLPVPVSTVPAAVSGLPVPAGQPAPNRPVSTAPVGYGPAVREVP